MSNTYAEFISNQDYDTKQARDMGITAFVGDGRSIQITLGADWLGRGVHTYFCLSEYQVKKLIKVLQARLDGDVTATGSEEMERYYPHKSEPLNEV